MQTLTAPNAISIDFNQYEATATGQLGEVRYDTLGNAYKYITNGEPSTAVTKGMILMQEGVVSVAATLTSSANGLVITKASAFSTAGLYSGFYVYVNDGGDEGDMLVVTGNDLNNLYLDSALATALNGSSTVRLFNPNVINIATGSGQIVPMGIAVSAIPAGYFGWAQVGGVANVLIGTAVATANLCVKVGDTTAGYGNVIANGNDLFDVNVIGWSLQASTATGKSSPVKLWGLL